MYMVLPPRLLDNVALIVAFPVESALAVPINTGLLRLRVFPLQTPLVILADPVDVE
jgi:hypothetical protein